MVVLKYDWQEWDEALFQVVKDFIRAFGYSPSVRELCEAMNVSSPATVWESLNRLRHLGLVGWVPGKNRTIRVLVDPETEKIADDLRESLHCLRLELPDAVWRDVNMKAQAVLRLIS